MAVKDIDKFEKQNNYVINVYGCDQNGGNIFPRRISKRRDQKSINLLMLENGEHYHYVLIKNLNKLLGKQGDPRLFCPYCCHGFATNKGYNQEKLEQHMETCFTYGGCKVEMPEIGKDTIYFKQYYNQQIAPYIIYADFEALMNKKSEEKTIHEISGFSLVVVSQYEKPQFFSHRGADAGKVFIEKIKELSDVLYMNIKSADAKMIFTAEDKEKFEKSTHCHICEGALPRGSTKIDHLANIGEWLQIMGLPRWLPEQTEVDEVVGETKEFLLAKSKLQEYLKKHNKVVVRDHCHWTGESGGSTSTLQHHVQMNLQYTCLLQQLHCE